MNVTEVRNNFDFKQFLEVPRVLYADDPHFISAMDQDLIKILTKRNNRYKGNNLKLWIARDESGRLTGRVASFFEVGKEVGGIGFFESVNDKDVAFRLLDAAVGFLRENRLNKIQGPVNFGERDRFWGLLVKGFRPPMYQENYNPPYYQEFFESYGFVLDFKQSTYEIAPEFFDANRVQAAAEKIEESGVYRLEHFKKHSMESYASDFAYIFNKSWAEYEFFEPMTKERVIHLMDAMANILREDLIWFTYHKDKPVAFYISIIDVNQILKHLKGKLDLRGMLKFIWYKNTTRIDRIKGLVFGVIPEYQGKGIYSAMIMRVYNIVKNDPYLKYSELSWVGDFNPRMKHLLDGIGARECKVHHTYYLPLTSSDDTLK